ncbi:hypothetical protein [Streptomyces hygroscopicus]|uniref:hypothetical protein n=1 Tax=Streptomyces hygroscopicus TaxID=1912 RepID=UPI0007679FF5|nr:hypothetical protein [Streptomyces hygroscopicus]
MTVCRDGFPADDGEGGKADVEEAAALGAPEAGDEAMAFGIARRGRGGGRHQLRGGAVGAAAVGVLRVLRGGHLRPAMSGIPEGLVNAQVAARATAPQRIRPVRPSAGRSVGGGPPVGQSVAAASADAWAFPRARMRLKV